MSTNLISLMQEHPVSRFENNRKRILGYCHSRKRIIEAVTCAWLEDHNNKSWIRRTGLALFSTEQSSVMNYILYDPCGNKRWCGKCNDVIEFIERTKIYEVPRSWTISYAIEHLSETKITDWILFMFVSLKCTSFGLRHMINMFQSDSEERRASITESLEEFIPKYIAVTVARYIDWE